MCRCRGGPALCERGAASINGLRGLLPFTTPDARADDVRAERAAGSPSLVEATEADPGNFKVVFGMLVFFVPLGLALLYCLGGVVVLARKARRRVDRTASVPQWYWGARASRCILAGIRLEHSVFLIFYVSFRAAL